MTDLAAAYRRRYEAALKPLAAALEARLRSDLEGQSRIDRVTARAKGIERFLTKAAIQENGVAKYAEPLRQIQDQVGARVVTFYLSDVERVSKIIEKYYRPIENKRIIPDSEWEFGYFGKHYVLLTPKGLLDQSVDTTLVPDVFELQIKTLFQHAWSEANHDLGYKPGGKTPEADHKRLLSYASAQAWGGDRVFDELFRTLGR